MREIFKIIVWVALFVLPPRFSDLEIASEDNFFFDFDIASLIGCPRATNAQIEAE